MSSLSTAVYSNPDTPIWLKADLLKGVPELKLYCSGYNPAPTTDNPYPSDFIGIGFAPSSTLDTNGFPTNGFPLDGSSIGQIYPPYEYYPSSAFVETREGYWTIAFSGNAVSTQSNNTFGRIWACFTTNPLDSGAGQFVPVSNPLFVSVPASPTGQSVGTPYTFQANFLNVPGQGYWFKLSGVRIDDGTGTGTDLPYPDFYSVQGVMIYFTPTGQRVNPSISF